MEAAFSDSLLVLDILLSLSSFGSRRQSIRVWESLFSKLFFEVCILGSYVKVHRGMVSTLISVV